MLWSSAGNSDNAPFQNLSIDWEKALVHDLGVLKLENSSEEKPSLANRHNHETLISALRL